MKAQIPIASRALDPLVKDFALRARDYVLFAHYFNLLRPLLLKILDPPLRNTSLSKGLRDFPC